MSETQEVKPNFLKSIRIENFRGIKSLDINGFKHLNVFVGRPNVCKTAVLESMALYLGAPNTLLDAIGYRGLDKNHILNSLFYDYDTKQTIRICSGEDTLEVRKEGEVLYDGDGRPSQTTKLILSYVDKGGTPHRGVFIEHRGDGFSINNSTMRHPIQFRFMHSTGAAHSLANDLIEVTAYKEKRERLQKACKDFSPSISNIKFGHNNMIMVEKEGLGRDLEIGAMGSGFKRYISLQAAIINGARFVLVDELENGLHFELIREVISIMLKEKEVQFFITTHSKEFMKCLCCELKDCEEDSLALFRLYEEGGMIRAGAYSQEGAISNIELSNEVRI